MSQVGSRPRGFRLLAVIAYAAISIRAAYATVRWLFSSHPWGALGPALFVVVFVVYGYQVWQGGPAYERMRGWTIERLGALAVLIIAALWIAALTTGDHAYRHEAMGVSVWGGFVAIPLLFVGLMSLHPKSRNRLLSLKRGELEAPHAVSVSSGDARKIVIRSGVIVTALVFAASRLLFNATWLEAVGFGVLVGAACAVGAIRGIRRIRNR